MQEVVEIHSHGGFHIRNFRSNSSVVLDSVGEENASNVCSLALQQTEKSERVLGLLWTPREDFLGFSTMMPVDIQRVISTGIAPTKRQVLKCLMSFYDPLGLLALFTVQGKIILQAIWRSNIQWDQRVGAVLQTRWQKWIQILDDVKQLQVPRCYFEQATSQHYQHVQLHIFVDASEDAYAAVAYFRVVDLQGRARCSLVAAKTKVAPIKPISIPRLELQAAVLGVRLMKWVVEGHSIRIERKVFWSDSCTVLSWIYSNNRRYKQFVAVRIGEIMTKTNVEDWRYVPSKTNIADAATKWGKGPDLNPDGAWFKGPTFLEDRETKWPNIPTLKEDDVEVRPAYIHQEIPVTKLVIDLERFSNWNRLLRTAAYVHRFINNSRMKCSSTTPQSTYLSQEELDEALKYLIRAVQWEAFTDEMATVTFNLLSPNGEPRTLDRSSNLYQLSPMLDERGILRVDSRIQAAKNISAETKQPVILPRKHKLTYLIIDSFHRKFLHGCPETVVNEIRQLYHVPKLRTVVKTVAKNCQMCRVKRAQPHVPRMAPLPSARLASFVRPFSYVGLDLFGPLLVKVGRSNAKRWIALFTCLTIRAVHLEVVYSLSTESCVMSVRRFVSRRGSPVEIHSDNGTNFKGADRLLREQMQNIKGVMAETFTNTTTKWVFIPPSAPHMGGAWERMVRSVKVAMEAANGGRRLDDEGLLTLAVEAEGIVNSRPLTYLPLDAEEAEALTPNHFILGSSSGVKQPAANPVDSGVALRNTWGQIQFQMDVFWKRWTREYLPTLTRRVKWFGEVRPIAVGDLVLVVEEGKRNGWARGRICEVYEGRDGRIRQALVQTSGGLIRRPVSKLAILDVAQVGKTGPGASGDQCYGEESVQNWEHCADRSTTAPEVQPLTTGEYGNYLCQAGISYGPTSLSST
ncbi:uncharacterized protein LOC134288186 [Aedes albopictus]|uniref:Integrase catalytic domain-containing protein n=1 Tax=Aedes albopictus TaxID=7160 RepID=A0ABM1Z7B5_AEDAL